MIAAVGRARAPREKRVGAINKREDIMMMMRREQKLLRWTTLERKKKEELPQKNK